MSSVSGLSRAHRFTARASAVRAAILAYHNASVFHYTQGSRRWEGIDKNLRALSGHFPNYADCSSFYTWCLWNALNGIALDTVNGTQWRSGYTGTMLGHGKPVHHIENVQRADAVIYGNGFPGKHTAIVVGKRNGVPMVISHGSEAGPFYLPYNYRSDIIGIRRYI